MARTSVKCDICNKQVNINQKFTLEYTNKNGKPAKKKGHKECVQQWHKDYIEWDDLHEALLEVLPCPALSGNFVQRLRELHQNYSYGIIEKTVWEKQKQLQQYFEKGWNYLYGIINNSIAQVYAKEQKKSERLIEEQKSSQIYVIDNIKGKKYDTTDYSDILD